MKCIEKPIEFECFQWFSNLAEFPDWFINIPDWAISSLDNGYWVVKENHIMSLHTLEEFNRLYKLVEEEK